MRRRVIIVLSTLGVGVGGLFAWQGYESRHDETCFEQKTITYEAGSTGTQPPRREFDC